jgi:polyphosphate kinase
MMHRNLDRRVEALVRLTDPGHLADIEHIFELDLAENTASWWLDGEGTWVRHHLDSDEKPLRDLQQYLIQNRRARSLAAPDADG